MTTHLLMTVDFRQERANLQEIAMRQSHGLAAFKINHGTPLAADLSLEGANLRELQRHQPPLHRCLKLQFPGKQTALDLF